MVVKLGVMNGGKRRSVRKDHCDGSNLSVKRGGKRYGKRSSAKRRGSKRRSSKRRSGKRRSRKVLGMFGL